MSENMSDDTNETNPKSQFVENIANRKAAAGQEASAFDKERTLWKGGYSAKDMFGTWAFSAILTIAAIVCVAIFANYWIGWAITGAVAALWWVVAISRYLVRHLSVYYELTTQRFIHKRGILMQRTDRIEVIDIDDVSFRQGIVQRMFNVGTIEVISSDASDPRLTMVGIDGVEKVATLIDDVRREERRKRGLHIESI